MRTTLDLPDVVLKKAKVYAVKHDMTLRELVTKALSECVSGQYADVEKAQASARASWRAMLGSVQGSELEADEGVLSVDEVDSLGDVLLNE